MSGTMTVEELVLVQKWCAKCGWRLWIEFGKQCGTCRPCRRAAQLAVYHERRYHERLAAEAEVILRAPPVPAWRSR